MALRIRLTRTGSKKQPNYRLVVADSRSPRDGRNVEIIGHYNPRSTPVEIVVDKERAEEWISRGARPSETAKALLEKAGVVTSAKSVKAEQSQDAEAAGK